MTRLHTSLIIRMTIRHTHICYENRMTKNYNNTIQLTATMQLYPCVNEMGINRVNGNFE